MTLNIKNIHKIAIITFLATSVSAASAYGADSKPPLDLETVGSFFAGGKTIHADNPCMPGGFCTKGGGDIRIQQVRVDFMTPKNKRDLPIVTVPGLGVRSTAFTSALDGREGWAQYFARRNFAVYSTAQSNIAAAGFNPNAFNTAKISGDAKGQPPLFHWEPNLMWGLFGFGPKYPEVYPDTRFKVDSDLVPLLNSVSTADFSVSDEQRQASMTAVLEATGKSILLTHSQSGPTGFAVAHDRGDLVEAHISVEPIGCKTEPEYAAAFKDIPVLMVFGDRIADRGPWVDWSKTCETFTANVNKAGGNATMISLPAMDIKGNTHFMMVENNSDEIAAMVLKWIEENVAK